MKGLNALQAAIYTALTGDATLAALVSGVYDGAPEGAAYPYITIDGPFGVPFDTKDSEGTEAFVRLHIWSVEEGWKQVQQIGDRVHDILHGAALSVSGYSLVLLRMTSFSVQREVDIDGTALRHGSVVFRCIVSDS